MQDIIAIFILRKLLKFCDEYTQHIRMSIILPFECSILGPSQMVNQQLRRHEDSTIHRYLRQGSEKHENPTNDITINAPMLQPIMKCSGYHQADIEKN